MKNLLKTIFITLLLILSSCSNQEKAEIAVPEESSADQKAYAELLSNINSYNSGFDMDSSTKGFFTRWFGRASICDMAGFGIGACVNPVIGIFLGAITSAFTAAFFYIEDTKSSQAAEISLNDNVLYENAIDLEACDSAGLIHNAILYDIYCKDSTCFSTYSQEEMFNAIKERMSSIYPEIADVTFEDYAAEANSTIGIVYNKEIDVAFTELTRKIPEKKAELSVIKKYCESIYSLNDSGNINDYSEGFREIVSESDIPEESKEYIRSAVAVAGSSELLWNGNRVLE